MPVEETDVHVDASPNPLDQGKHFEPNLALEAAQDLLRTDTVAFGDPAAQAAKMTGMPAAGATAGRLPRSDLIFRREEPASPPESARRSRLSAGSVRGIAAHGGTDPACRIACRLLRSPWPWPIVSFPSPTGSPS